MVPDGTCRRRTLELIFADGPENVFEAVSCAARRTAKEGQMRTAHFLVIAAPRPSGLPDLDSIQTSVSGGRLFCETDKANARIGQLARSATNGSIRDALRAGT
jgi:hypothetical protein